MSSFTADAREQKRLGLYLAGDTIAALTAATLVTPSLVLIDRVVVEKAANTNISFPRTLWRHTREALQRPGAMFMGRPFWYIWAIYAGTYTVAGGSDTLTRAFNIAAADTITFIATTAVNIPLGVWKDISFARLFSSQPVAKIESKPTHSAATVCKSASISAILKTPTVPRSAAGIFLLRDCITIFGSITLAPRVATRIPDSLIVGEHTKATLTQLTVPALTQLAATPLHLVGLDLYQRQDRGISTADRIKHVSPSMPSATVVRCIRILPAFGLGIVTNAELRTLFHSWC